MLLGLVTVLLWVHSIVRIEGLQTKVSLADLANCSEYSTITGYGYQTYFKIDDMAVKAPDADLLNIKVYVLSANNAHVLLSTEEHPAAASSVYEIVLGAGANSFSEIRRKRKTHALKTVKRKDILSPINVLPVQMQISKDGLIQVTVNNEDHSFLNTTDSDPIAVRYISFSSWGTTLGKWFFDCHLPNDGSDLYEVIKNLTPTEQIFANIFKTYDASATPAGLGDIDVQLEILRTSYKGLVSSMTTRAIVRMNWTDPMIAWNKTDYEGVDHIVHKNWNYKDSVKWPGVWMPPIYLHNGKNEFSRNLPIDISVRIQDNGQVLAESHAIAFETWCGDIETTNLQHWPSDELSCDIMLGTQDPTVRLTPSLPNFVKIITEDFDQSEWHLMSVRLPNRTDPVIIRRGEYTIAVDLVYRLKLQRNSLFYKRIFCAPLIGAHLFVLLSFWCRGFVRAALNLLGAFVAAVMFIVMADYAPLSYVPTLVTYYQWSLVLSWLAFVAFVIDCCLDKYTVGLRPYDWLAQCMSITWLRLMLAMDISNSYNRLQSSQQEFPWHDIRQIFDRIIFLVFSGLGVAAVIRGI